MFRTAVQPRPFGKGQAGEWRRVPKWLIKSHSDATRVSWKIPLMSAVSNVSHRKSHQGQQPSRANYWGQEQLRMVLMGFVPRAPRLRIEHSSLLCGWTGRWAIKGSQIEQVPGALAEASHRPSPPRPWSLWWRIPPWEQKHPRKHSEEHMLPPWVFSKRNNRFPSNKRVSF